MLQYQIERIDHQIADDRSQAGTFLIGPLERGQATTLGNSLRRVLMGGLEGSAVTAVRIAGINHCLLYTSPSPRDAIPSRMPSSA